MKLGQSVTKKIHSPNDRMVWDEGDRETLEEMTYDPGDKKEEAVGCDKGTVGQEL